MTRLNTAIAISLLLLATGCALEPKPYSPAKVTPLQDPLPGKAIVYLLRAPYDSAEVAVFVGGATVATISPAMYTAISLPPGRHVFTTRTASILGIGGEVAPSFHVDLEENQRRFLNLSGANTKAPALVGALPLPGGGGVPLVLPVQSTAPGSRTWKEVSELDAQGLMSISAPSLPERDAL
jgi:hypothetical protein